MNIEHRTSNIERWMERNEETDLWPREKAADYCRTRYISILQPSAFNL